MWLTEDSEIYDFRESHSLMLAEDEEFVECHVSVSRREALYGADRVHYMAAADEEKLRLIAQRTWRAVEDGELRSGDQILPTALIFTRKRPCDKFPEGRFKARLVALGNVERWKPGTEPSTYAPVCSYAANRYITIKAASKKLFLKQFDITLAFTNAELTGLEKSIFVRLPKEWDGPDARKGTTVKLLRALYGLRLSPLLWYRTYKQWLESQGWVECEKEPGLFHLITEPDEHGVAYELWLTVYVDDSLI
jgi:hypothetical protein